MSSVFLHSVICVCSIQESSKAELRIGDCWKAPRDDLVQKRSSCYRFRIDFVKLLRETCTDKVSFSRMLRIIRLPFYGFLRGDFYPSEKSSVDAKCFIRPECFTECERNRLAPFAGIIEKTEEFFSVLRRICGSHDEIYYGAGRYPCT